MASTYRTLIFGVEDGIAKVQFNREKDTNSFSRQMTLELMEVCRQVSADGAAAEPAIGALILTGGTGRSFSVGGDFNDVSRLTEEPEIRAYLGEIIDLYIAILQVDIPVVAAIDRFAIGQGLQVALMADWRIGAHSCQLQMPELKNGVACPLGSIILEVLLGRAKMQELVFDCELIDSAAARAHGLLSQLSDAGELQATGLAMARRLSAYPRTSFVTTKRIQNQRMVQALETVREPSSQAHVAAFLKRTGKKHFEKSWARPSGEEDSVSEEEKVMAAIRKLGALGVNGAPMTRISRLRDDLGLDSVKLIELTVLIHQMYGVNLGRRAAERKAVPATVGDLAALMASP